MSIVKFVFAKLQSLRGEMKKSRFKIWTRVVFGFAISPMAIFVGNGFVPPLRFSCPLVSL